MTCNLCIHYKINVCWMDTPEKIDKYYCYFHYKNNNENCKYFNLRILDEEEKG